MRSFFHYLLRLGSRLLCTSFLIFGLFCGAQMAQFEQLFERDLAREVASERQVIAKLQKLLLVPDSLLPSSEPLFSEPPSLREPSLDSWHQDQEERSEAGDQRSPNERDRSLNPAEMPPKNSSENFSKNSSKKSLEKFPSHLGQTQESPKLWPPQTIRPLQSLPHRFPPLSALALQKGVAFEVERERTSSQRLQTKLQELIEALEGALEERARTLKELQELPPIFKSLRLIGKMDHPLDLLYDERLYFAIPLTKASLPPALLGLVLGFALYAITAQLLGLVRRCFARKRS